MSEQDLAELEVSSKHCKETIETYEAYDRLSKNKDFKHLIEDTYFLTYASRLVLLRAETNLSKDIQENILREIDGIGFFRSFLKQVIQAGHLAKNTLSQDDETREEILGEGI